MSVISVTRVMRVNGSLRVPSDISAFRVMSDDCTLIYSFIAMNNYGGMGVVGVCYDSY